MENFWQTCSAQLEQELTPQQFSAWIKPLAPLDFEDGRLRIAAPNRFKLDWVKTQFASRISTLAAQFWEAPIEVQFVLDPRIGNARRQAAEAGPGSTSQVPQRDNSAVNGSTELREQAAELADSPRREQSKINTALTFDSFVTGKANQ